MTTTYATLLFPSYATAKAAAQSLGFWDTENDRLSTGGQAFDDEGQAYSWAIDEIGQDPITVPGTYDEEGNEITPPTRLSGYAVNVVGRIPPAAMAYAIPYGSAGRIYAGTEPDPIP